MLGAFFNLYLFLEIARLESLLYALPTEPDLRHTALQFK